MAEKRNKYLEMLLGLLVWGGIIYLVVSGSKSGNRSYNANDPPEPADSASASDCKFEDGSHSATVDYYNPETGHSATYDLTVEVEDCEVTTIYFPKGGWLDDSHISSASIDEDGNASIEDDQGRSFEVHLDE
jgi:hypothetical protein